jgi:hypothetical protein
LQLLSEAVTVIDGSKFTAVNSRDGNGAHSEDKRRSEQLDESTARYLSELDSADREQRATGRAKRVRVEEQIEKPKDEIKRLKEIDRERCEAPNQQLWTDPVPTPRPPVGTVAAWTATTRRSLRIFTRTLPRVRTKVRLHALAYDLKRVINILGTGPLLEAPRS